MNSGLPKCPSSFVKKKKKKTFYSLSLTFYSMYLSCVPANACFPFLFCNLTHASLPLFFSLICFTLDREIHIFSKINKFYTREKMREDNKSNRHLYTGGVTGLGGVIRDRKGVVVGAKQGKDMVLKLGFIVTKKLGASFLIVEPDCEKIIKCW